MSIEKALKAKNPGVFIENLQAAFINKSSGEILDAFSKASNINGAPEIEIKKIGLMSWCDEKYISDLKSKILLFVESEEYRSAMIGCMYLFGAGENSEAISLSEKIFQATEASSDYEFNASSVLSILIGCSVEWKGASNGKYYVKVDKNYLSGTILSVADDFRQSEDLFNESRIVELAIGLAKSDQLSKSNDLLKEYLSKISDYTEIESLIYNFTRATEGIPTEPRSIQVPECDFVNSEFTEQFFEKAKEKAKKQDKESLQELSAYIKEY